MSTVQNDPQPLVVCFGEILWDFLPDALYPGGAPFNVAYHLSRHGCSVHLVSAVGADALGDELRRRLAAWGLDISGLRRQPHKPTGYVRAQLGAEGAPAYDIARNVAWDGIEPGGRSFAAARKAAAFAFGSLAQRTSANQRSLEQLLEELPENALRVFDVNLRPPYVDRPLLRRLARQASLLKLNTAEAAYLVGNGDERPGHEERDARTLFDRNGCRSIVITAGARGAGWLLDGKWYWEPARPVKVVDTIGAGDAFLATLISGLLLTPAAAPAKLLATACRRGEWVARHRGATPAYV
jgi:fructokinase